MSGRPSEEARQLARDLRAIEPAMRKALGDTLDRYGDAALRNMRAKAEVLQTPDRRRVSGAFRDALRKVLSRPLLKLQVGLVGVPDNKRLFYASILEGGRRAQTVQATRHTRGGKTSTYLEHVRGRAPEPVVFDKGNGDRDALDAELRGIWDRALYLVDPE